MSDKDGNIALVNARAESLFGYPRDEFLELRIEDLLPERIRSGHLKLRENFNHHPEVRAMGAGRDLYARRKDGTEFPVEIGLNPLEIEDQSFVLSSVVDITARKKTEEKLRQYAAKLNFHSEILNNVHDAVFFADQDGIIHDWNAGAERIFKRSAENVIGMNLRILCPHPGTQHPFDSRIQPAVQKQGLAQDILRCQLENGHDIFIRVRVTRLVQGDLDGYVFCASDITDRKQLETQLLRVAEEEQRKIGQDLHDDLCSQLSGIGCLTKVLEQQLESEDNPHADEIKNISGMVASAGVKAREMAHGLAASVLQNRGLADALRDLARRTESMFGIPCHANLSDFDQSDALTPEFSVQIYRIAQEAITNAAKHSDAEQIELRVMDSDSDRVELSVSDNGRGMAVDLITNGMGLITMQRRAELLEADFSINASPGKGTRVSCSIPITP